MIHEPFDRWFASCLGESEIEVARLLNDKTAVRFLIVWSILESKCLGGFMKVQEIRGYANRTTVLAAAKAVEIRAIAKYFHARYQDKKLCHNLLHKQKSAELAKIITAPFAALTDPDIAFLLLFVVYRFRNNIFHGNKGVQSWLQYREQIGHCIAVMQALISESEAHNQALQAMSKRLAPFVRA